VLRTVERLVADALPPGWSLRRERASGGGPARRGAASWRIQAPDGTAATFAVQIVRTLVGRDVDGVLAKLATDGRPFIAAAYLGPTVRSRLADRKVSYGDTTGHLRVVAERPGVFMERAGSSKDPWPSDDALLSLRGPAAGRAVRALVDFRPPYGVRELADRAGVALGSLSRTLDLLDRDGLVTRGSRGEVLDLDWEGAIRRWSRDYSFTGSNAVVTFLEPRGLGALTDALTKSKRTYAATGSLAAQRLFPVAPARQAAIYVDDIVRAADRLRLRPADTGANVVLAEPFDPVAFDRSSVRDGLRVVAVPQLAVDLLTGPGREPSEGNELLAWMRKNEDAWRA
jgi:hypothetical protein